MLLGRAINRLFFYRTVAPFAGAWIEISRPSRSSNHTGSRSLHGSVGGNSAIVSSFSAIIKEKTHSAYVIVFAKESGDFCERSF